MVRRISVGSMENEDVFTRASRIQRGVDYVGFDLEDR